MRMNEWWRGSGGGNAAENARCRAPIGRELPHIRHNIQKLIPYEEEDIPDLLPQQAGRIWRDRRREQEERRRALEFAVEQEKARKEREKHMAQVNLDCARERVEAAKAELAAAETALILRENEALDVTR